MVEKYIKIYHKQNMQVVLLCALIAFLPLFIVSLFHYENPKDILISFFPFVLASICLAVASLYTIRFRKLIAHQERIYNIKFQDTNVVPIGKTLYLSDQWLIWAGSGAFYKKHIKTISSVRVHGKYGFSYKAVIKTVDDKKFSFWCNASDVNKIRKWKKM